MACTLVIVGITVWTISTSRLAWHFHGWFGSRTVSLYRLVPALGAVAAPDLVGWITGQAAPP